MAVMGSSQEVRLFSRTRIEAVYGDGVSSPVVLRLLLEEFFSSVGDSEKHYSIPANCKK